MTVVHALLLGIIQVGFSRRFALIEMPPGAVRAETITAKLRLGRRSTRRAQHTTETSPLERMRASSVRRGTPMTLAVATTRRSAGSRWKLSGSEATSAAIIGSMGTTRTSGKATARDSHSLKRKNAEREVHGSRTTILGGIYDNQHFHI